MKFECTSFVVKSLFVVFAISFFGLVTMGQVLCDEESGSKQQDWLIPEIVALPMNAAVLEEKQAEKYEPRKLAASLIERKREFDKRWSKADESVDEASGSGSRSTPKYELVSFFPEEHIDSLIKNGHLNGHELPQLQEREKETAILSEDMSIGDEKERLARLIADSKFMKGRGQWSASIQLGNEALKLARRIEPDKVKELEEMIAFLQKVSNDPATAASRAYGWERRAELEDLHLGLKLGEQYKGGTRSLANSLRAKYGIVNVMSPTELKVSRRELAHYGALIIVYRDELRWRCSYSFGDSTVLSKDEKTGLVHGPELKAMQEFSLENLPVKSVPFIELQVWGPVDLADIKEFRVPAGRDDLVAALTKAGLPVYTYNRKQLGDEPAFVPASALGIEGLSKAFAGNPQLEEQYRKLRIKRISQP